MRWNLLKSFKRKLWFRSLWRQTTESARDFALNNVLWTRKGFFNWNVFIRRESILVSIETLRSKILLKLSSFQLLVRMMLIAPESLISANSSKTFVLTQLNSLNRVALKSINSWWICRLYSRNLDQNLSYLIEYVAFRTEGNISVTLGHS